MGQVARGLEGKVPELRDDVTNSLLLFDEVRKTKRLGQISKRLITAQLSKTAREVCEINLREVVNLKGALRHLRLFIPLALTFSLVLAVSPA